MGGKNSKADALVTRAMADSLVEQEEERERQAVAKLRKQLLAKADWIIRDLNDELKKRFASKGFTPKHIIKMYARNIYTYSKVLQWDWKNPKLIHLLMEAVNQRLQERFSEWVITKVGYHIAHRSLDNSYNFHIQFQDPPTYEEKE